MGGLSGMPLKELSNHVLHAILSMTKHKTPIIASGGIFNGEDANKKIKEGASLVQVWTGFIYEGPGIVKKICTKL